MIIRKKIVYSLEKSDPVALSADSLPTRNFVITLPCMKNFIGQEQSIITTDGSLEVRLLKRSLDLSSSDPEMPAMRAENCFDNGEVDQWIMAITFKTAASEEVSENFYMYLPLSLEGVTEKPLSLWFNGTWLRILMDGEMLNESSGIGDLVPANTLSCVDGVTISNVSSWDVDYVPYEDNADMGMYFPNGFNTHVGDVMSFAHDGVYHIAYLIDRRHHRGRNGRGAHYIAHITTRDLKTWEEQPPIAEIENPYETFGTGTMFFHKGKYYMSYGIHTSRHPVGKFCEPEYNEERKEYAHMTFADAFAEGGLPIGATLSVSDDGINFKRTELIYHGAQNPSVYSKADGGLILYGGYGGEGVYETDDLFVPFKKSDKDLTFCGPDTALNCSSECPSFFEINGYSYLVVGFKGYFRALTPGGDMTDAIKLGENIYDGLCVPMVTTLNGRTFIAGWIMHELGWGGAMLQRELFQEENGKLGMKWIPELYPEMCFDMRTCDGVREIGVNERESYIFEGRVKTDDNGVFALNFKGTDRSSQLKINTKTKKAQVTNYPRDMAEEDIPTPYEKRVMDENFNFRFPFSSDYAIPDVDVENEFDLRFIIRFAPKMRTTVIDIEISGKRTMILVNHNFFVNDLKLVSGDIVEGKIQKIKS